MEFFLKEKDEKIAELNKELSINDEAIIMLENKVEYYEFLLKSTITDLSKLEEKNIYIVCGIYSQISAV